ncbi:pectin lyase fold domain-containing protein [Rhizobium phage RHph_I46]|uniref:Pectin lyase fold domain-containing protein n=1 Tax=Rhizobium phage RHph_I1_9 TaxID=2509729 RepID=A0A7S5UY41_9CAUD|nr:pectin lyase fold domain-containing protein [Rhizobium phage RHph_I1_9]QIG69642.1 pectin lyase fold domain-containing protein [Rhizobium phage RHph_I46]QIG70923.1 pectin lyase fold domain-containing protein [Rhizobium phage RHph_I9]QIG73509.1 pectin lyase fold domain-containing protein [Rhizobium phage RHph_I1_9]QIG76262.1 pectin lyase fold domain-containing protein [Rhizobium phage RHph_I34]
MARKTIDELPVASPEAVATGTLLIADENGLEYRATTAILGGVHLFFTDEDDQTPFVFGRLTSPGRTVENIQITLTATPVGGGTAVVRTTLTDALGNFTYDFTSSLARGVSYTIEGKAASYLAETTTKTIAALSAPIAALTATSTAKVGDDITVDPPSFSGSPTVIRYRYLRGSSYVIPGADSSVYTLQPDDDADTITPQVQATNAGGDSPWYPATAIGPVSNKESVLLTNPVISGSTSLGGRVVVSEPGSASNYATVKSDEWQLDGARIPTTKAPLQRYFAGAANASAPTTYPDGSNHHGVNLSSTMYTGSNTYSYSVGVSATENDYLVSAMGAAGGNEGPQVYDLFIKHINTNAALRFQMFAAKYRGGVLQEEVQMPKIGVAAGTELNELTATPNAVNRWTLTHDFGEWLAGDVLVFRQRARNTSGSSTNNYQWDARNGASYAMLPIGPVNDLQKTLSTFTTRADMAGKKVRLARTFSNRNNDVIGYSNEITLEAAATQTAVPANVTLPAIVTSSDRSNNTWQADFGAWSNQPSGFAIQWLDNGADISGATQMSYKIPSSLEGHEVSFRVTATNDIGSTSAVSLARTVLPAAVFYKTDTGNDSNDGSTPELAKQTLNGSDSIPSGSTAIMQGDFGTRLRLGNSRNYEGVDTSLTSIGSTSISYAIDQYTDDGSIGRSNIKLSKFRIKSGDRAINARQGSNWVIEDVILENVGFSPIVSAENASGMMFYKNSGLTLRRVQFLLVNSDALFSDTNDRVLVEDCTFLPVFTSEGDNIQTRADRLVSGSPGPHQKGFVLRGSYLDMHSRKTSSGKGCLVTNMQDYAYIHDNDFDGNNFVHGTDEGDNHVFTRNICRYARKNTYSFGYGIGGYDDEPASHNHHVYDNYWYDINRAHSYTGIPVTGYTGTKSGRIDIMAHDETIVKCAVGARVDRPTSGKFRGFVFHNVSKPLDRTITTIPSGGEVNAFIWSDHYTYNGSVLVPPGVTTRATITGTRTSGSVLTGGDSVFDTAAVLAAFPSAVITRSYQWRRHKPAVKWTGWSEGLGWMCEWIDGATSQSYTLTDDDQGCLVSRVDRIHLTFTEGGVSKTVTALAYDGSFKDSTPITRTGDLAVALPTLATSSNISASATEGTLVLDLAALITGETRSLLHPSRAFDPYTGTAITVDSNGDIVRGAGTLTVGSTFSVKIRQKRGIDIVDSTINFTVIT